MSFSCRCCPDGSNFLCSVSSFSLKLLFVFIATLRVSKFCTRWKQNYLGPKNPRGSHFLWPNHIVRCDSWRWLVTGFGKKRITWKKYDLCARTLSGTEKGFETMKLKCLNWRKTLVSCWRVSDELKDQKHFVSAAAPLASSLCNRLMISANLPSRKDF